MLFKWCFVSVSLKTNTIQSR